MTLIRGRAACLLGLWMLAGALAGCPSCGGETTLEDAIPLLTGSATTLDFGDVVTGGLRVRALRVTSTGTGVVHVDGATIQPDGPFSVQPFGARVLGPGESMELLVAFRPEAVGPRQATLRVENDSRNASPLDVQLTGTAVGPPSCNDDNPCTDDTYNPATEECVHINNASPCDSGSLCTQQNRCVNGQCLGVATVCEDNNPCTRNLCDAVAGCVFVPVLCEDGNTCTVDFCDPLTGCSHRTSPDGAPCEDGNLCSLGDTCRAGVCRGEPGPQDPAAVSVAYGFGSRSRAVALPDGRVVFVDALRSPTGLFTRATTATTTGGVLRAQARSDLTAVESVFGPVLLADGLVSASVAAASGTLRFGVFSVEDNGSVVLRGTAERPGAGLGQAGQATRGRFHYVTGYDGGTPALFVVDARVASAPVITTVPMEAHTSAVAVDPVRDLLLLGGPNRVERWTLADPSAPALQDTVPVDAVVSLLACDGTTTFFLRGALEGFGFLDAATGVQRANVPHPGNPGVMALAAADGLGFALSGDGQLFVLDLQAPQLAAALDVGATSSPAISVAPGTPWVVTAGSSVVAMDAVAGSPPVLTRLPGPGHGTLGLLSTDGARVHVSSPDSAHRLELSNPAAASFSVGSRFGTLAPLISFNTQLRTPTVVAGFRTRHDPAVMDAAELDGSGAWMDASDLMAPRVLGTGTLPRVQSFHRVVRSDGRRIYMVGETGDDQMFVGVVNPDSGPGSGPVTLGLAARLDVPAPEPVTQRDFTLFKDDTHHTLVVTAVSRNTASALTQVVVVDLADPLAPRVQVDFAVPYRLDGAAGAGNLLALVEAAGTAQGRVFFYTWDEAVPDSAQAVSALDVPFVSHVMLMDAHVMLASTREGVAYANVTVMPPVLMGQVETPESRPLSALIHQQHLLLSFPGEVVVLSPPCPLPPVP